MYAGNPLPGLSDSTGSPGFDSADGDAIMNSLWYRKPASNWNEALPLGNGRMGAMVFGGALIERISMNEDSLWYGGFRDRVNPDARENLPRIRQLLGLEALESEQEKGLPEGGQKVG